MRGSSRQRAVMFENIMARQTAFEARTLADLRNAGWNFLTTEEAFDRLHARRQLHRLSDHQLEIAIAVADAKARKAPSS